MSGDGATASVFVRVSREDAFVVFTREIDKWWRTGPKYRVAGKKRGELFFEAELGGRLFETFESSTGPKTFEVGKVIAWDPPRRMELEWRISNFAKGEKTFVEVTFEEMNDGTMVKVRHRGWAALRPGHPARHGLEGAAFSRSIGMWWADLLTSLREHTSG